MRSELYRQVATAIIDTDDRAPEAVADEVVGLLAPAARTTDQADRETACCDHRTPPRARPSGSTASGASRADAAGVGRDRGLVACHAPRAPTDAGSEQLQRCPGGPGAARSRRRRLVPAPGLHPPRLGRTACRAAVRRGHPPRHGVARRHPCGGARGRLHPVRSRRDRLRDTGRAEPAHCRRQQRALVAVHPAGRGRGPARRHAAAASISRLLQLRRAPPQRLALRDTTFPD